MNESKSFSPILVALACIVIVLAGVKAASQVVVPFLLSLFIAIICSPLISFFTRRRVPTVIAVLVLFGIIASAIIFLAGLISNTINEFIANMPQYRRLMAVRIDELAQLAHDLRLPIKISRSSIMAKFDPNGVMNVVSQVLLSFSGMLTNLFVVLLVVVFMLFETPTARAKLTITLSGRRASAATERHISRVLKGVIGYLGVKTMMSLLTAVFVWGLLHLMGVQYAVLWATLSFLFNYIPNIGSLISSIPIVLQAFLLNGLSTGMAVLGGLVVMNVAIASMIEPRLMGRRLGLSTLVVFLSLIFWGWLLGSVGMLLSVPLTMALKITLESNPSTKRYAVLLSDEAELREELAER